MLLLFWRAQKWQLYVLCLSKAIAIVSSLDENMLHWEIFLLCQCDLIPYRDTIHFIIVSLFILSRMKDFKVSLHVLKHLFSLELSPVAHWDFSFNIQCPCCERLFGSIGILSWKYSLRYNVLNDCSTSNAIAHKLFRQHSHFFSFFFTASKTCSSHTTVYACIDLVEMVHSSLRPVPGSSYIFLCQQMSV